ncbi:MAG: hypothetical protein G8345_12375 [Magnetococcales bacterium]|nr:hypothetical protein [Magnetococcales bacterium]NGZ27669.1 hypothetical protein [Magnetococcales bacterium]
MNQADTIRQLLEEGIPPVWRKVEARWVQETVTAFLQWRGEMDKQATLPERLYYGLAHLLTTEQALIDAMQARQGEFLKAHRLAKDNSGREQIILDYARTLGSSSMELRRDAAAFNRWFGLDAMIDRYSRQLANRERRMVFYLRRMADLLVRMLATPSPGVDLALLWRRFNLEAAVRPLLAHDGDGRVRLEAFRSLATALRALPNAVHQHGVSNATVQYIMRAAQDHRLDIWIQCEALELLETLAPQALVITLSRRLTNPQSGDDLFVRRRAVLIMSRNKAHLPEWPVWLEKLLQDPSPTVRQILPQVLKDADSASVERWLPRMLGEDPVPQCRAAALLILPQLVLREELAAFAMTLVTTTLFQERHVFVLRVALECSVTMVENLLSSPRLAPLLEPLAGALRQLHQQTEALPVRRWTAMARERIWVLVDHKARLAKAVLAPLVASLPPDGWATRPVPPELSPLSPELLARVLSVLAQRDFGLELERGWFSGRLYLRRGHRFGFRFWRLFYEITHPSPDKRQAFSHTIGRLFPGRWRAPSAILAELAQTKVPGEPLHMASEEGWRPYLPLPDEFLSSLEQGFGLWRRSVWITSSEGVTEIIPPPTLWQRWLAWWQLTMHYARYARLRNWREQEQQGPEAYGLALKALGFQLHWQSHGDWHNPQPDEDPQVRRFFPAMAMGFTSGEVAELLSRLQDYFFSVYENTLFELVLFTLFATLFFFMRHIYLSQKMRWIRAGLPLVIGGWGTRGKSGVERLKAALINALGHSVVSKTTGCEAMFPHGHPFRSLREMFLFRPYDKATIWEQFNVSDLAKQLKTEVMLWECMALTPDYVEQLQRHWMRDDFSTITNTFPDHEDIQGPAGINIPGVMTCFIPENGRLLTSEQQMLPILRQGASALATGLTPVTWLESGMLAPDVLERFSYQEHPDNIALVLALAESLSVERDFALKEMADRVVPDLGVLKTYPTAQIYGRRLQFINGMSANERFGTLSNWNRLGFDQQDYQAEPGVWITTVVNNRADRIARSRVFAGILTDDIEADRFFLIGSNVNGLVGYIETAWQLTIQGITLWPERGGDPHQEALAVLMGMAKRLRLPMDEALLAARWQAMVAGIGREDLGDLWHNPELALPLLERHGVGEYAAPLLAHLHQWQQELLQWRELVEAVATTTVTDRVQLDQRFRQQATAWFMAKLVVVEDFHASGDQVVALIATSTPPGFFNRIMGMQNIKGTGLDYVYRWQAWDQCHKACSQVQSMDEEVSLRGLEALVSFQDYGLLCETFVQATLTQVQKRPYLQKERRQADLNLIASQLEQSMTKVRQRLGMVRSVGWLEQVVEFIETFLDAGDAVKRRKIANQIYQDLVDERISHARAAQELKALNKRQKGGWLYAKLFGD